MDDEKDFTSDVLKRALGIFLGGLLLWGAFHVYVRYTTRAVLEETGQALQQISANAQMQSQRIREQQQLRREQQEARRRAELEQKANAQAAAARYAQERAEAERRKEEAWRRFYQPSEECLNTASVECGNAHIRARREFERTYGAP